MVGVEGRGHLPENALLDHQGSEMGTQQTLFPSFPI